MDRAWETRTDVLALDEDDGGRKLHRADNVFARTLLHHRREWESA